MSKTPKVAIVHDYLVQYGGAEKTLEAICELFPNAPIYTGIYNPKNMPDAITKRQVIVPNASGNFLFERLPKHFSFLMPALFEGFDFEEFDLIISEGTTWAKSVLTKPHQLHISYVHTPPRFLYKYSVESLKRNKWYYKPFVAYIESFLRVWDFSAAQRPNYMIANSYEVQNRIQKFYSRNSTVIYPPVEIQTEYKPQHNNLAKPFYVALGRLSAYKNFDLLIQAFNLLDMPLTIIGTGKEEATLKKMAKPNITFLGKASEELKHQTLENSLGLIFPVEDEDFGITPIEAMSHGKPVLAHRSGGPLETIRDNRDGMFFDQINLEHLVKKIKEFDEKIQKNTFDIQGMKIRAQAYSKERFKKEFMEFVMDKWETHNAGTSRSTNNHN